eukprot:385061_1
MKKKKQNRKPKNTHHSKNKNKNKQSYSKRSQTPTNTPPTNNVKLELWDTAGQERYHALAPMYYRGASGAILVYDITRNESFEQIKKWYDELKRNECNATIIIAGNKIDLCHQQVSDDEAINYAQSIGSNIIFTSAKTGENVNELFRQLCEDIVANPNQYGSNFKVVLLGDTGGGKSSLLIRYNKGTFSEYQESTIGAAFQTANVPISGKIKQAQMTQSSEIMLNEECYQEKSSGFLSGGDWLGGFWGGKNTQKDSVILKQRRKLRIDPKSRASTLSNGRNEIKMRGKLIKKQLYQEIEATKEYQETYWYNVPYEDGSEYLIQLNKFWCSFAEFLLSEFEENEKKKDEFELEFLCEWVLTVTCNIHEIICCVALLNLSFESDGTLVDKNLICNRNDKGSIVFIKELCVDNNMNKITNNERISVNVCYYDTNDAYFYNDFGEKTDKFISLKNGCFYTLRLYCCCIVLTNVCSIEQSLKVLVEIPSGSIPVNKGDNYYNKTHFISINSYSTKKLQFLFYFPSV